MSPANRSFEIGVLAVVAIVLVVSLVDPLYPRLQLLQHVPTVAGFLLLGVASWRRWVSRGAFVCCAVFLLLHIVGARWIYTLVPYDDWSRSLFGSCPADWFGWTRNHYDRGVHLAFGFLAIVPLLEFAVRRGRLTPGWALAFAIAAMNSTSAVYEIFEWVLTIVAHSEQADAYNGQQGDAWDTQKDMALAAIGGLLAAPWAWIRTREIALGAASEG